jgi:hypothetical protein
MERKSNQPRNQTQTVSVNRRQMAILTFEGAVEVGRKRNPGPNLRIGEAKFQ